MYHASFECKIRHETLTWIGRAINIETPGHARKRMLRKVISHVRMWQESHHTYPFFLPLCFQWDREHTLYIAIHRNTQQHTDIYNYFFFSGQERIVPNGHGPRTWPHRLHMPQTADHSN